tara:strand:+ start:2749 stop:3261 length:513 start_codon:yes stop_codon:yes gene_type:complete
MKISNEQAEHLIKEQFGKETLNLTTLLKGRKNVNEFKIAEKLELTINQVRNMLYRLQEYGLVSSIRKKDKKKGWYVYYWTFSDKETKSLILSSKMKRLTQLKEVYNLHENETHFICSNNCVRLNYQESLENNFKCEECGELLVEEDKEKVLKSIEIQIDKLEKELKIKKD